MNRSWQRGGGWLAVALALLGLSAIAKAQSTPDIWPPLANGERLTFHLMWPSGINLGEAVLEASRVGEQFQLKATIAAELPQYRVGYTFSSMTDRQLCSIQFSQMHQEGSATRETIFEFDQADHRVRRAENGELTESRIPDCARDPLALLYHFRRQLALGLVPIGTPEATGAFYLDGEYAVRYEAITPEVVKLGTKQWEGDRFLITARDSQGELNFEVWIRPDQARTPVAIRVPFALATFSAELQ